MYCAAPVQHERLGGQTCSQREHLLANLKVALQSYKDAARELAKVAESCEDDIFLLYLNVADRARNQWLVARTALDEHTAEHKCSPANLARSDSLFD